LARFSDSASDIATEEEDEDGDDDLNGDDEGKLFWAHLIM
jgi:hypothetical protein